MRPKMPTSSFQLRDVGIVVAGSLLSCAAAALFLRKKASRNWVVTVSINGHQFKANLANTPHDCSLRISPHNTSSVSAFGLPSATAHPITFGSYILDTTKGGSVNVPSVSFNAHGNGTHTECIGHISKDRITLSDINLDLRMVPTAVISVTPSEFRKCNETYGSSASPEDRVLTLRDVNDGLSKISQRNGPRLENPTEVRGLIIRTLPNEAVHKKTRNWGGSNPPYFTREAIEKICLLGITHLVVDVPSVDREDDGGELLAHRSFFEETYSRRSPTITELALVESSVEDGLYLMDLQVAPFDLDASPSRPLLYSLKPSH